MSDMKITYDTAVICDMVRREDNGKAILIGVYNQDIIFGKLPGRTTLSAYIAGTCLGIRQETPLEFRIKYKGRVIATGKTDSPLDRSVSSFAIVLPGLRVDFDDEGPMSLEVRPAHGRWKTLKILNVKQRVSEPSTV